MLRFFCISGLFILFTNQAISQNSIVQPCATDQYNDQMMQMDPSFAINLQNAENQISSKGGQLNTQSTVVTIPVVVHIVYNTTAQNISDAQILSQIDALNEDFRMLNPDTVNVPVPFKHLVTDAQIEFCLAQRDPSGNPTTGITRTYTSETSFTTDNKVKYTSQGGIDIWDRNQYLNIWVCHLGGSLGGYAQFPGGNASTDGVVVAYTVFGRAPYVNGAYNKGRVTVHEVGHWLNLRHLWGSGSCGDDYVNDTPIHAAANYFCPTFPKISSCSGADPNGELFMNHMDYTNDGCKVMFTTGQAARMNTVLSPGGLRYSLLSSLGCQQPTGIPVCELPSNFSATNITQTAAQLSWIGVGANSYNVRIRETGSVNWTNGTASGAVVNVSGLTAATQYDFQAQSVCTGLNSAWSWTYNFTTVGATCNVPIGISAGNITTTSAQIVWNTTGAPSYNVRYKVTGTSFWTTTNASATFVNVSSLSPGTQYDYQVQSDCGGGTTSAWSATANFTTPATCNTPSIINTDSITFNSVMISWNNTGATSYELKYKINTAGAWNTIATPATSYILSGLDPETTYEYQIRSICNGNNSPYSIIESFTTLEYCAAPSSITLINISQSTITVELNSTNAVSYQIRFRPEATTNWFFAMASGQILTLSGLVPETMYEVQVKSVCNNTNSSYSSSQLYQTSVACMDPQELDVVIQNQNSVLVTWVNTNAGFYEFRYKITNGNMWNSDTVSINQIEISNLDPATNYDFEVRSICNEIDTSGSSSISFNTTVSTLDESESLGISIYPNPVEDILNLETNLHGELEIEIFNTVGTLIKEFKTNSYHTNKNEIYLGDIASGVYIIKINTGDKYKVHRLIKSAL